MTYEKQHYVVKITMHQSSNINLKCVKHHRKNYFKLHWGVMITVHLTQIHPLNQFQTIELNF